MAAWQATATCVSLENLKEGSIRCPLRSLNDLKNAAGKGDQQHPIQRAKIEPSDDRDEPKLHGAVCNMDCCEAREVSLHLRIDAHLARPRDREL